MINMINFRNDPLLISKKYKYFIKYQNKQIPNLYRALIKKEDFKDKNIQIRTTSLIGKKLDKLINYYFSEIGGIDKGLTSILKYKEKYCNFKFSTFHKAKYRYKQICKTKKYNIVFCRVLSLVLSQKINKSDIEIFSEILKNTKYFCDIRKRSKNTLPLSKGELLSDINIYLAGVIVGDGHLNKRINQIVIVDGNPRKELIEYSEKFMNGLSRYFKKQFNVNTFLTKREKMVNLRFSSKCLLRFFNHFFDIPFGNKSSIVQKPKIIFFVPKKEGIFWRGLFDTDGSVAKKRKGLHLVSKSKNLIDEFEDFCLKNKILYKRDVRKRNKKIYAYNIMILSFSLKKYTYKIGFFHPLKAKKLIKHLKEGPKYILFKGVNNAFVTKDGYYDFSKINNIRISGLGKYFLKIRNNLGFSQTELAKLIKSNKHEISNYENNHVPIHFSKLLDVNLLRGLNIDKTIKELERFNPDFSTTGMINKTKLPFKPNKNIFNILKHLRPYRNSVYIRFNENLCNIKDKEIEKKLNLLEKTFGVKSLRVKRKRKHDQFYICSKLLSMFLKKFHIFGLPWERLSEKEIKKLQKNISF